MTEDDLVRQLHDKATRGLALSAEEQAHLAQWYARQDQEEGARLSRPSPAPSVATLQVQVDASVAQLLTVTERIQTLAAENEAVRREVSALQQRLAQQPTTQPA
jgi:hypothetical protein